MPPAPENSEITRFAIDYTCISLQVQFYWASRSLAIAGLSHLANADGKVADIREIFRECRVGFPAARTGVTTTESIPRTLAMTAVSALGPSMSVLIRTGWSCRSRGAV